MGLHEQFKTYIYNVIYSVDNITACVYAYIYIYTYIYVVRKDPRTCVCMYTSVCVFICLHLYLSIRMYACMHACVYMIMYI